MTPNPSFNRTRYGRHRKAGLRRMVHGASSQPGLTVPASAVRLTRTLGRMTTRPATGYSGTPLARKLGIVAGKKIHATNEPREYKSWLDPLPAQVAFEEKPSSETDLVHIFVDKKADLAALLPDLRKKLKSDVALWVSWPKKAAKVPTDITEDTIRDLALPLGFVDVKVCAVSEVWSGLKLVVRKAYR